jgi:hypothetical protein
MLFLSLLSSVVVISLFFYDFSIQEVPMRLLSLFAGSLLMCGVAFTPVDTAAQLRLNPYPVAAPEDNFDWKSDAYRAEKAPMPTAIAPMPDEEKLVKLPVARGPSWSVVAGQDVRSILEQWSKAQGVEFIWDGGIQSFKAVKSLDISGAYEEAVRVLLGQYDGRDVRPVGTIYLANASQKKTLVVSVSR